MQVGDLVRHIVHTGVMGIIIDWNGLAEPSLAKVLWNNSWGAKWELSQHVEVIDANR